MSKYNLAERLVGFYRRNGLLKTFGRVWLSLKRTVLDGEMVLFHSRLEEISSLNSDLSASLVIERITREEDIPELALRRLLDHWNEKIMRSQIKERFGKGADLWLAKLGKDYSGFGWSIIGTSIEPYFFPLTNNDAHFFNFYIFPEYRGRGINFKLVNQMLLELRREGIERAFIETHAWNKPEIRSLRKTYFYKLGEARKVIIFGKPIVLWSKILVDESSRKSITFGGISKC